MDDRFGAPQRRWERGAVGAFCAVLLLVIAALASFSASASAWQNSPECLQGPWGQQGECGQCGSGEWGAGNGQCLQESLSLVKEQKLAGEEHFTTSKLTGRLGETVDYKITATNTGTVAVKLQKFIDANCTNIAGPGSSELNPGESTTYTCEHKLTSLGTWTNEAEVETCTHITAKSNKVEVETEEEPSFKVVKEQKIAGEEQFTTHKLTGKIGEVVLYKITVVNTGNTPIVLAKITDADCTNILGPGKASLAPGESTTYSCEHELTHVGIWTNVAEVETCSCNRKVEKSNTVEVEVPTEERFEVKKEQKLAGEASYTTAKLTGALGQVVDYKITVTNLGNMTIKLAKIIDSNCSNMTGPGMSELAPGVSTYYTCEHTLTSVGIWTNEASVETCNHKTEKSNKVEVEVPGHESFRVEKEQKLAGEPTYTKSKLTGKLGETVDYLITVTNTGNSTIGLIRMTDANCTNIVGPGKSQLNPGESTTYTCDHVLTSVGIWVNEAEVETCSCNHNKVEKSNKVEVEVPGHESFRVEKEQKLAGEATYTKSRLTGKLGETVDYLITVTNTGNSSITLAGITDTHCTNIVGPGTTELGSGESTTYTCEHVLTSVGTWTNEAEVETNTHKRERSNKVEVEVPTHESFRVEKEQKLFGEASFTKSRLVGKLGETVEYEIIVTNTGNADITLASITDANCTNIVGPGKRELGSGESTTYTCEHVLTSAGTWTNEAEVETSTHKRERSNKVEVEVPAQESFRVEKLQKLFGEASFTKSRLEGKPGETVEYEIIVTNTGNVPVELKSISDANCTNIVGPGKAELGPGESTTYTCEHVLTVGTWPNEAAVESAHKTERSNRVEVEVPEAKQAVKPECTVSESKIVLHGANGSKRTPFKVQISAFGIKQITFYLDGRKVKTLEAAQAKNGVFTITIDPRKLSYGAHHVSVRTVMEDSVCAAILRSGVFVHPRPRAITPKFTG